MSTKPENVKSSGALGSGVLKNADTNKTTWASRVSASKKTDGSNKNTGSNNYQNNRKKFQGSTKGIEDNYFYYGKGMDVKYITSKEAVLGYIAKKYSASEEVSIESGNFTILGRTKPSEHKVKADFEQLPFHEQEEWKINMKRYSEMKDTVQKNLTACYAILWGQLTDGLRNEIKRVGGFATIEKQRDAIGLFGMITLTCNKTTKIDHYATRLLESMQAVYDLSGNKMSLGDFHKAFTAKHKTAVMSGADFSTASLKTQMLLDFSFRYAVTTNKYKDYKSRIDETANQQMLALIFLRQAGDRYEEVRRSIKNSYVLGSNHIQETVEDAYRLLQIYETISKSSGQKNNRKQNDEAMSASKHSGQSFAQGDFR